MYWFSNKLLLVVSIVVACLSASVMAQANVSDAEKQSMREAMIGTFVVAQDDYAIYSPQAERQDNSIVCYGLVDGVRVSPSELQETSKETLEARYEAITQELLAQQLVIQEQIEELTKLYQEGTISQSEYVAKLLVIQQDMEALEKAYSEAQEQARSEANAPLEAGLGELKLYLIHTPTDPNATIIPMEGHLPSEAFVSKLNSGLSGFLRQCGNRGDVYVSHYYDSAYQQESMSADEPAVLTYKYSYLDEQLELLEADPINSASAEKDPAQNPELTLAGFRGDPENTANLANETDSAVETDDQEPTTTDQQAAPTSEMRQEPARNADYSLDALVLSLISPSNEEVKAMREEWIGPIIASGEDFTVHSPQAVQEAGRISCAAAPELSSQEILDEAYRPYQQLTQQRQAMLLKHSEEMAALVSSHVKPATEAGQQLRLGKITQAEYDEIKNAILAKEARLRDEHLLAEQALEEQIRAAEVELNEAENEASTIERPRFYLQHTPSDANATIIPMQEHLPTLAFIAELNEILGAYLQDCGDWDKVDVNHYFRDVFGEVMQGVDLQVLRHHYAIRSGQLQLLTGENENAAQEWNDARNPRLTLAGYRVSAARAVRLAGDYRQVFSSASSRLPGIVYKLDDYWESYEGIHIELPRRIFDGDFEDFKNTIDFKAFFMMFAEFYSDRCADHVEQFATYRIPYETYIGTQWNLDGSRTVTVKEEEFDLNIDARFTPQWGDYRGQVNTHRLEKALAGLAESQNVTQMTNFEDLFAASDLLARAVAIEYFLMEDFFSRHACNSATVQQLGENFIRAANDLPSVQSAGLGFEEADVESDPATEE